MNVVLMSGIGAGLGLALLLAWLFRRAMLTGSKGIPSPAWAASFRPERYRPMERLLREADFEFLASQPGFTRDIERRLRAERRRIFGEYLQLVRRDFDRLYAIAKMTIVQSGEDRSEFLAALFRQRVTFVYACSAVQLRLAMHLASGTVDVRGLVDSLESMRLQVRQLVPAVSTV
jgi:hypothetical protein